MTITRRAISVRKLGARILVFICSGILALLVGEGLARVFFPAWAPRTMALSTFWRYDPRYGWSHIPGAHGVFTADDGKATSVIINTKGFRGPESDYARAGIGRRILLLGDSMAWGFGVDYDETFGALVERMVPDTQVINLAVSGYSTDQELLVYRDEGYKYRPDLVVIVVAANDPASNARTLEYLIYGKPAFVARGDDLELVNQPVARVSWLRRGVVHLVGRSYMLTELQRYMYQLRERRTLAMQTQASPGRDDQQTFSRSKTWQITTRLLLELKGETGKRGSRLLVMLSDGVYPAREVAKYLTRSGVDAIVMDDYLNNSDKSLHLSDGIHWSPAGHKVVATVLAEKLNAEDRGRTGVRAQGQRGGS